MRLEGNLNRMRDTLKAMAGEKAIKDMRLRLRHVLKDEVLALARETWQRQESPYGSSWKGQYGPLSLQRSGRLRSSLRVVETEDGILLEVSGEVGRGRGQMLFGPSSAVKPVSLAAVQTWGGSIRALRRGRPMRALIGGRWVSSYEWRMPRNVIVPMRKTFPPTWSDRLALAAKKAR